MRAYIYDTESGIAVAAINGYDEKVIARRFNALKIFNPSLENSALTYEPRECVSIGGLEGNQDNDLFVYHA